MNEDKISHLKFCFNLDKFPTGEPLWSAKFPDSIQDLNGMILIHQCYDWNDILTVIAIDQFLKRKNINVEFYIPYLPSSRNDRPTLAHGSDAHFIVDLLKKYSVNVITADPHSYVTAEIRHLPQSVIVDHFFDVKSANKRSEVFFLIPDQGAYTKAKTWLLPDDKYIIADKVRDPNTGKLTKIKIGDRKVFEEHGYDDKVHTCILIVDDIWDGGGTFNGLAKEVLNSNGLLFPQHHLKVLVTHGLFNKGLDHDLGHVHCLNYQPPKNKNQPLGGGKVSDTAHYELYRFLANNYDKII